MKTFITALTITIAACFITGCSTEYHVSTTGFDVNPGTKSKPFKTISAAAVVAQPGDTIMVHEGLYRERINPPRGGESDKKRIVYQAAPGENVTIKGSEVITGWKKLENDTWEVTLPNSFFGDFNPYSDLIWGDWFGELGRKHHTGAVYLNGHWLDEAAKLDDVLKPAPAIPLWFAKVDDRNTTIYGQFKGVKPNEQIVEINVRQSVFYPEKTGRNYITLRGFTLEHAATPWAPPTAEQIGLVGTHWSKGWIIENNVIRYSRCVGVALGKYGDEWDNRAESAEGYVGTINRALKNGWNKKNIGSHIVRNNHIYNCEQAGIVGSLGCAFSTIYGNTIHDIHVRKLFSGAEIAGIKFHGAVDTVISDNHIYRCYRGYWLDWMTQGARVTRNLLHDNEAEDLFVEMNHGPLLVDHNIFLSPISIISRSQGTAYAHNLITGLIYPNSVGVGNVPVAEVDPRITPYHKAHSTEIAGLHNNPCGDDRWYNNVLVMPADLANYDLAQLPVWMKGNVFLKGARPSRHEADALVKPGFDPLVKLVDKTDGFYLVFDELWSDEQKRSLVTSDLLGSAHISKVRFEQRDGSPLRLNTDYLGNQRNEESPASGPFELLGDNNKTFKVGRSDNII
ncbi:MAG: right-handed parallel beta-helix repeat-containing protein [Planctomycetes bacterium]|nr:right-handed parallel beta-helix repeat-containing protein [Planctomycetota bacterium]